MLKNPNGEPITNLPHPEKHQVLLDRLENEEKKELTDILVALIKKSNYHNSYALGSRYINSIPRLHALLLKSAGGNEKETGGNFGLLLFVTFMQIEEEWFVKKSNKWGRIIEKGYDYYKHPSDFQKRLLKT